MILTVLGIIFPVFAVVVLGYLYGRKDRLDMTIVNRLNMRIFVPALVFHALSDKSFDLSSYAPLIGAGSLVILGSGLLVWPLCRWLKIPARTFVPPMMFNNAGNMFLPLALLAFGPAVLAAAVVLFLVEMVLHFTLGLYIIDSRTRLLAVIRQPTTLAMIAGVVLSLWDWQPPAALAVTIKMLGDVSIPLLLFSLGVRMTAVRLGDWKLGLLSALLCPLSGLIMAAIAIFTVPLPPTQQALLWLFGALPPAVLNFVVAEQYQRDVERTATIVLLGNFGAVIVMPLVIGWVLSRYA